MWFKKQQKPAKASPERMYEVMLEFNRLKETADDDGFMKFGIKHFEELPERTRAPFLVAVYEEMRKTVGQVEAEQWAADRLHLFSSENRQDISNQIWGDSIYYFQYKKHKTGRSEKPDNVDEWTDPKVNPKARKPKEPRPLTKRMASIAAQIKRKS